MQRGGPGKGYNVGRNMRGHEADGCGWNGLRRGELSAVAPLKWEWCVSISMLGVVCVHIHVGVAVVDSA